MRDARAHTGRGQDVAGVNGSGLLDAWSEEGAAERCFPRQAHVCTVSDGGSAKDARTEEVQVRFSPSAPCDVTSAGPTSWKP